MASYLGGWDMTVKGLSLEREVGASPDRLLETIRDGGTGIDPAVAAERLVFSPKTPAFLPYSPQTLKAFRRLFQSHR